MIVINFKTYDESIGENGIRLAQICDEVAKESGAKIIVCPIATDIYRISQVVRVPVFAQHFDAHDFGSHTGSILAEAVKRAGAKGSLINHSENRLTLADIDACVKKLGGMDMASIVCTNNIATTSAAAALKPAYVAVEPPELIGSGISVSQAQPQIIRGSVDAVKGTDKSVGVLCGAGISNGKDVKAALELGADGVLLASAVTKAKKPKDVLYDLIRGM